MFGNFRGLFGIGLLLQPCPICDHPLSSHMGRDWQCTTCGCTGFPERSVNLVAICTCGHAKEAHQHGYGCGECGCLGWDPEYAD